MRNTKTRDHAGGQARGRSMMEDEARNLLRDFAAVSPVDAWIAGQPWTATPDGWHVGPRREGWSFEIRRVPEGLQIRANAPGVGTPGFRVLPRRRVLV